MALFVRREQESNGGGEAPSRKIKLYLQENDGGVSWYANLELKTRNSGVGLRKERVVDDMQDAGRRKSESVIPSGSGGVVEKGGGKIRMSEDLASRRRNGYFSKWHPEDMVFLGIISKKPQGCVHKAYCGECTVAVKILSQSALYRVAANMLCEAQILRALCEIAHPNLVKIHAIQQVDEVQLEVSHACLKKMRMDPEARNSEGVHPGVPKQTWVVMEYCNRGTLMNAIRMGDFQLGAYEGPNYSKIIYVGLEVACGMEHLHKLGIIHGNLKAQNVLLRKSRAYGKRYVAKVSNFGLYNLPQNRMNKAVLSKASIQHISPETLWSGKLYPASDVFSFAMLLLKLCAGKDVFQGMTRPAISAAVIHGMRPAIPSSCPAGLLQLIQDCWQHDRHKRPTFHSIVPRLVRMVL